MTNRSQELYDQWQEYGGNLQQYSEHYPREITNDRRHTTWFRSGVVRWKAGPHFEYDIGEKFEELNEQESHIRWKHNHTDTWMHIKSSVTMIVGEPIGFKAYVTINGQSITVGEYEVSTDPHDVIEWAVEWMNNHPEGYENDD